MSSPNPYRRKDVNNEQIAPIIITAIPIIKSTVGIIIKPAIRETIINSRHKTSAISLFFYLFFLCLAIIHRAIIESVKPATDNTI